MAGVSLMSANGSTAPDGQLVPRDVLYRVRIRLDTSASASASGADGVEAVRWRESVGAVRIDAERRSLLGESARYALSVLIRESGF